MNTYPLQLNPLTLPVDFTGLCLLGLFNVSKRYLELGESISKGWNRISTPSIV